MSWKLLIGLLCIWLALVLETFTNYKWAIIFAYTAGVIPGGLMVYGWITWKYNIIRKVENDHAS